MYIADEANCLLNPLGSVDVLLGFFTSHLQTIYPTIQSTLAAVDANAPPPLLR
jgi:hypothetical protein